MEAKIISKDEKEVVVQIKIPLKKTMLETEESIQSSLNMAGSLATEVALSDYDTDGSPIMVDGVRHTTKGLVEKIYQTPYGEIRLPRHVYQNYRGGKTYCPLEKDAKIIVQSTPKFAKMVSSKYAYNSGRIVLKDLNDNHGRYISRTYIKNISDVVGQIAVEKGKNWSYLPPVSPDTVKSIGFGLDGTCMFMSEDGWRQAMVGTIAFYGEDDNRLDTIYLAADPEYGKNKFITAFEKEIDDTKRVYPHANYIGIADGASDNWTFLSKHTDHQVLDFFHASEYVTKVADIIWRSKTKRSKWLTDSCHKLKHENNGSKELLNEFIGYRTKKMSDAKKEKLEGAITYFTNHLSMMNYSDYIGKGYPIGSGITESACKVIVKQRMCNSGMQWKQKGAESVLCLRALSYSYNRWNQMWDKINKYSI